MKVKLTKEQIELLEQGSVIYNKFYFLPFWFEKTTEPDVFIAYHLDKSLPKELLYAINHQRNPDLFLM
jgi:hypothetical protein